jgi:hypothetical protein
VVFEAIAPADGVKAAPGRTEGKAEDVAIKRDHLGEIVHWQLQREARHPRNA